MSVTAYSKTHTLRWPIVDDKGQQLTVLNIHTLSLRTVRELRAEYGLVDGASDGASDAVLMKFEKALLLRSTGLSDSEYLRLCVPDYNSILRHVRAMVNGKAELFLAEQAMAQGKKVAEVDPDAPVLLVPVEDKFKGRVSQIAIQPPTVHLQQEARKHTDPFQQTLVIVSTCTELDFDALLDMHMPDWNTLTERVTDFLSETADFFPTSTAND